MGRPLHSPILCTGHQTLVLHKGAGASFLHQTLLDEISWLDRKSAGGLCLVHGQVDACHYAISMGIPVNIVTELLCPVGGIIPVERDIAPIAIADGQQDLFAMDRQLIVVKDTCLTPLLDMAHRIHTVHPGFRIRHHHPASQELTHFRPCQNVLLHHHLLPGSPGEIAVSVVIAFGQQQVHFP